MFSTRTRSGALLTHLIAFSLLWASASSGDSVDGAEGSLHDEPPGQSSPPPPGWERAAASERYGSPQTAILAFHDDDGRSYTFRSTDKDPSAVLDPVPHDTAIQALVQQMTAAQHPGGALASSVISEAAGVLTIHETAVVMPDDPILGEFREEFAGMVGTFFEFPTPRTDSYAGFYGATEIIDHQAFYDRLRSGHDDDVTTVEEPFDKTASR